MTTVCYYYSLVYMREIKIDILLEYCWSVVGATEVVGWSSGTFADEQSSPVAAMIRPTWLSRAPAHFVPPEQWPACWEEKVPRRSRRQMAIRVSRTARQTTSRIEVADATSDTLAGSGRRSSSSVSQSCIQQTKYNSTQETPRVLRKFNR